MSLADPTNGVVVQIVPPDFPFGGVQAKSPDDQQIQIEISPGGAVSSVFERVGDVQAQADDYALFYAPLGSGLPVGGSLGQTLVKLSDSSFDVGWGAGAGAGTVLSVGINNLSPLFTASVADPTANPVISFALSAAPAKKFFGNPSNISATPGWNQVDFLDLTGSISQGQGGLPAGGTTGQALVKQSGTDYDTTWVTRFTGTPANGNLTVFSGATSLTNLPNALGTPGFIRINTDDTFLLQNASDHLTSIGGTTVGKSLFTLGNPSAISFIRMNADNSVTARTASQFLTDLGATAAGSSLLTSPAPAAGMLEIGNGAVYNPTAISGANVTATLSSAGVLTLTNLTTAGINNAAVTLAKIQSATASSKLIGSGASGLGAAYSEITLGTNLTMVGTTLNATSTSTSPGGSDTQMQYNNSGSFGGFAGATVAGGLLKLTDAVLRIVENSDPTVTVNFNLANIATSTGASVNIGAGLSGNDNSTTVVPSNAPSHQFATGIAGATGVISYARPAITDLTNLSTTSLLIGSAATAGIQEITLGAGLSISGAALTIGTLNQNTTGSAAGLSISGQTGILLFTGLASTNRTKTVRDASDTILELGGSYTPTGNWTNLTLVTPILGTPQSGNLANCTFPTLNQNTTGSAASLSISGQSGLLTFTGLTSTNRAKTIRDAADTIIELGGSYTPTGVWTLTNAIGLPVGTGISGLGTGVATALAVNNNAAGGYSPIDGTATLTNKTLTSSTNTIGDNVTVSHDLTAAPNQTGGWKEYKVSGSNFTTTNATATTITGLTTDTLVASTLYEVEFVLWVQNDADTTGMKFAWTGTNSPSGNLIGGGLSSGTNTSIESLNTAGTLGSAKDGVSAAKAIILYRGFVISGTGSPTISAQVAKVTSGTATVLIGSKLRIRMA